jgi:hypothetical protein
MAAALESGGDVLEPEGLDAEERSKPETIVLRHWPQQ